METHHYKSTTHDEMFFHFIEANQPSLVGWRFNGGTVFARKADDGKWLGAVALCSKGDQFCRERGRQTARRTYFAKGGFIFPFGVKPDWLGAREFYLSFAEELITNNTHSKDKRIDALLGATNGNP